MCTNKRNILSFSFILSLTSSVVNKDILSILKLMFLFVVNKHLISIENWLHSFFIVYSILIYTILAYASTCSGIFDRESEPKLSALVHLLPVDVFLRSIRRRRRNKKKFILCPSINVIEKWFCTGTPHTYLMISSGLLLHHPFKG